MTWLLVALGAAVGAPLRYLLTRAWDGRWPWGTLAVNVAGSALLGVLSALALSGQAMALLGVGFCGALTTFSTFAAQAVDAGPRRGTAYAVLSVALCLGACAAGFVLAAS